MQYQKIRDKELWNINDVGRCASCCQPVDHDDKRVILVQGGEGSAEIVRLQHGALHRIVRQRRKCHTFAACPIVSKKKELVGDFKNAGREWRPEGNPEEVRVHDFSIKELGRAVPYGVYDLAADKGWINVGIDHDTAAFAVATIRRWWQEAGRIRYLTASRLLITADGGGSNGSRVRLWKYELQRLADEIGVTIEVHHFPPGTSKWNKIEHRLFSFVSQNWRAVPLISYQVIVDLIAATTTKTGLEVQCQLDTNTYPKGITISDAEMAALNITRHNFHGEWNYTFTPRSDSAVIA